ncbi:MAG: hypothetical protein IT427_10470 [Pirellulales bacterium]|nr:hypothetical protein [Pirellulales bacterium]
MKWLFGGRRLALALLLATTTIHWASAEQLVIPGTGVKVSQVGDNFEDSQWSYRFQLPKSSEENDQQQRLPGGYASNGRWAEALLRGQPDTIERVATPPEGLPGSEGSLLLASLHAGVPGQFSGKSEQDDFIANVATRLGHQISVAKSPSIVVRIFLPPWEKWEQRRGNSFGFRVACQAWTTEKEKTSGLFGIKAIGAGSSRKRKLETYWPGMFIYYNQGGDGKAGGNSATLLMRAGPNGADFRGPEIKETGWWTLGMSIGRDGCVHYFAKQGVENLTAADHLASQYPYGFRCDRLDTFFFDIVCGNHGDWSTPWIIDDPSLYVIP